MESFPADEQRVIRGMANLFYITRSIESLVVGNSLYRAFFMRPTDDTSAVLNVEREFAVLIAPYDTFEARTLKAYDQIYDKFDAVRIDRSIRFLVSKDARIEHGIRLFLSRNLEYPVIVPFTYSGPWSAEDIYSALRRNYIIRDLFGLQAPLKEEHFFFGREALIADVIELHKTGNNSGVFGLRKSGKTSTIYAIQRRARSADIHSVVIDCQNPAVHARNSANLLFYIVSEVRKSFSLKKVAFTIPDNAAEVADAFRQQMARALGEARSDCLLIFDEIENISPSTAASQHWRTGREGVLLWQTLRSFFQSAANYRITFCFVGTNPSLLEAPKLDDVDNPVYLFARKTFIPNLSEADTRSMVKHLGFFMGLDFPDEVMSYVHSFYGGHPFFTRQLCSQIHSSAPAKRRPVTVSKSMCDEAAVSASASTSKYIDDIFNRLSEFYPQEYEMLELLACGDVVSFREFADQDHCLVEHLLGYQIIVRRGDDYEFVADNIRRLLRARRGHPKDLDEERWNEIGSRRNRLEREIRSSLYQWSRPLSDEKWKRLCQDSIPKFVREKGVPTRDRAFSRSSSPLCLLDLMRYVIGTGITSGASFTLSEVKAAFHNVNKHRIDAHAKSISRAEYDACMDSLSVLESLFLPPD